jgi:hypothetical protein
MANSLQNPFLHVSGAARKILPTNKGRIITRKTFVEGVKKEAAKQAQDKKVYSPIGQKTVKRMAIAVATGTKLPNQGVTNKELAFGRILRGAGDLKAGRFTNNVLSAVRTYENTVNVESAVSPEYKKTAEYKKKVAARIARRLPVRGNKNQESDLKKNVSASQVNSAKASSEQEKSTQRTPGGISNVIRLRHEAMQKETAKNIEEESLSDNVIQFPKSEPEPGSGAVLPSDPASDNLSNSELDEAV